MDRAAEVGDRFGLSLTSDDYDGDGYADLGVGVPHEKVGGIKFAGAVNVICGDFLGLAADGNQFWSRNGPGIIGDTDRNDYFGGSLTP